MHTFWIVLIIAAVPFFVLLLFAKSRTCRDNCDPCQRCEGCCETCDGCEGCCEILWCPFECCPLHCTIGSLPLFVLTVVVLWGSGLAAVAWLVLSLVRS